MSADVGILSCHLKPEVLGRIPHRPWTLDPGVPAQEGGVGALLSQPGLQLWLETSSLVLVKERACARAQGREPVSQEHQATEIPQTSWDHPMGIGVGAATATYSESPHSAFSCC